MSRKILIPVPSEDFDPTETSVPWKILRAHDFVVHFATPDGLPGEADERMLTGKGLGIWSRNLKAEAVVADTYREMAGSAEFQKPITYAQADFQLYDGLILPGGHAPGMRTYLESLILQEKIAAFFASAKPTGAICHGVVLAARSKTKDGKSILHRKRVTALPKWMELSAWAMTCLWMGDYYRTYPQTVEGEVRAALADGGLFDRGPLSLRRDDNAHLERGFCISDGNLVTARWPGDAHQFTHQFIALFK